MFRSVGRPPFRQRRLPAGRLSYGGGCYNSCIRVRPPITSCDNYSEDPRPCSDNPRLCVRSAELVSVGAGRSLELRAYPASGLLCASQMSEVHIALDSRRPFTIRPLPAIHPGVVEQGRGRTPIVFIPTSSTIVPNTVLLRPGQAAVESGLTLLGAPIY